MLCFLKKEVKPLQKSNILNLTYPYKVSAVHKKFLKVIVQQVCHYRYGACSS